MTNQTRISGKDKEGCKKVIKISAFSIKVTEVTKKHMIKREKIEEDEQKACQRTCATVWLGTGLDVVPSGL